MLNSFLALHFLRSRTVATAKSRIPPCAFWLMCLHVLRMTLSLLTALMISSLCLGGCASGSRHLYEGDRLPTDQLARFYTPTVTGDIEIETLDGEPFKNSFFNANNFYVLPGRYILMVNLRLYRSELIGASKIDSKFSKQVIWEAEAGRTYRIVYSYNDTDWRVWMEDFTEEYKKGGYW